MNKKNNNNELKHGHSVNWFVINTYRILINELESLEIGDITEFNTVVTKKLIDTVKKRYEQLYIESSYNGVGGIS